MKFTKGQRVMAIGLVDGMATPKFGTVKGDEGRGHITVEFDEEFDGGWICGGLCKKGCGRIGHETEFAPATMENE